MTEVIMPKMGDGMEEGTLLEWLKKDGDAVKSGEVIGTIQTDKATLELESPGTGTLSGIKLEAGGTVPVGQPIAAILKPGESLPYGWGGGVAVTPAPQESATAAPKGDEFSVPADAPIELQQAATTPTRAEAASTEFGITADQASPNNDKGTEGLAQSEKRADSAAMPQAVAEGRVKASPLARRIASEKGVDLAQVTGTGPGGRIVEKDVVGFTPEATPMPSAPTATPAAAPSAEDKVIKLPSPPDYHRQADAGEQAAGAALLRDRGGRRGEPSYPCAPCSSPRAAARSRSTTSCSRPAPSPCGTCRRSTPRSTATR